MFQRVRDLRKEPTPAEALFWEQVRNRRLGGFKFRRQHRLGFYVVDFFCPQAKLIVEVDGDIHNQSTPYDNSRTQDLEAKGYKVLRFTNQEISTSIGSVKEKILLICHDRTKVT